MGDLRKSRRPERTSDSQSIRGLDESDAQIVGLTRPAEFGLAEAGIPLAVFALDATGQVSMVYRATRSIVAAIALSISLAPANSHSQSARPPRPTLPLDRAARVLVVAPHPDDETLAAGGLMQRVHAAGGTLRVVYLTDGEGFPEAVKAEEGREHVTASDYRALGRERKDEARSALRTLGIDGDALTFLGFPNGGLSSLLKVYWSERHPPYESPYTRRDRPTKSEIIEPGAKFRGEDLTQELATIIGTFRPTLIVAPRAEEQHADHCAAWFFVADALGDVARVDRDFHADLITYVIHFDTWPWSGEVPSLPAGRSGWLRLRLTDQELQRKRDAIHKYKTQMRVMDSFLEAFARRTEVFARPPSPRVQLPLRRSPCDQFKP
jgi:LmbE family N-acetylglucosaminyl deacetylase